MKYSAIIWDIDGTLLNSMEGLISSYRYTINLLNLDNRSDEEIASYIGPTPQTIFQIHFHMDENSAQAATDIFREHYKKHDLFKAKVYDGIFYILENLKKHKVRQAIATNKREDYAKDLMKHLEFDKYFDSICGADNENKLTKTDILKKCLKELSCENQSAVLIGDSCHDGRAANEAGIDFIGVTYGFGFKTKDEIKEFNPVLCAENINDIVEFFEVFNNK